MMVALIALAREQTSKELADEAAEICSEIVRKNIKYRDIRDRRRDRELEVDVVTPTSPQPTPVVASSPRGWRRPGFGKPGRPDRQADDPARQERAALAGLVDRVRGDRQRIIDAVLRSAGRRSSPTPNTPMGRVRPRRSPRASTAPSRSTCRATKR